MILFCLCLTSLSIIISRSVHVAAIWLHSFLWLCHIPLYICTPSLIYFLSCLSATSAILKAEQTLYSGYYEIPILVKDSFNRACELPQVVELRACGCDGKHGCWSSGATDVSAGAASSVTSVSVPDGQTEASNVGMGSTGIGMITMGVLLLLRKYWIKSLFSAVLQNKNVIRFTGMAISFQYLWQCLWKSGNKQWDWYGHVTCSIMVSKNIHWKDKCWRCNSNTLATWREEPTHWKRPWYWERLRVGGEGGDRGWDGWMASPTQWTWVWANSGR